MVYMGFNKLKSKLASEPGVTDPGGLAASIGRKKYGATKFNTAAKNGTSLKGAKAIHAPKVGPHPGQAPPTRRLPPAPPPAPMSMGGGMDTGESPSVGTAGVPVAGPSAANQMGDVEKFAHAMRPIMESLKHRRSAT